MITHPTMTRAYALGLGYGSVWATLSSIICIVITCLTVLYLLTSESTRLPR